MRRFLLLLLLTTSGCRLFFGPDLRDPPATEATPTPERLERGRYLVEAVTTCWGCHTEQQKDVFGLPPKPDRALGTGGDCFGEPTVPGLVCAPNITNHADGIKDWTDGELLRALREGVDDEGDTIFPMMPYPHYRTMSDEDALAIIAYVRTATPAAGKVRETDINWPVSAFLNFAPKPLEGSVEGPDPKDEVAVGRYLATIGGCKQCHSPVDDKGRIVKEELFTGGQVFKDDTTVNVVSANLTPHATGIGKYTRAQFIGRFKSYADASKLPNVTMNQQSVMPWYAYANMTEDDIGAIYAYLMTLTPVEKAVTTFPGM